MEMCANMFEQCCRFRWDVTRYTSDFSITPVTGYISPGMTVTLTITFHPKSVSQDIRCEVITQFSFPGSFFRHTILRNDCFYIYLKYQYSYNIALKCKGNTY